MDPTLDSASWSSNDSDEDFVMHYTKKVKKLIDKIVWCIHA